MKAPLSRRSLLVGLGGGIAATSLVWSMGGFGRWRTETLASAPVASRAYVDHEGWFLTVEDKSKLLATAKIKHLDNTNLPGGDIANKVVIDEMDCALWCLMDPRCKSFAFTKPGPDVGKPNVCWIKESVPGPVASEFHISGILE
jgi:hypothetical protein